MQPAILDNEKPYLDYHAGRAVRKASPRTKHALVQGAMLVILRRSAGSDYRVGAEWDCGLSEQLGNKTLLVGDVSATPRSCKPIRRSAAASLPRRRSFRRSSLGGPRIDDIYRKIVEMAHITRRQCCMRSQHDSSDH